MDNSVPVSAPQTYEASESFARKLDAADPLFSYRKQFYIPRTLDGEEFIYFAGNSLGLQPVNAKKYIAEELEDWAKLGVEGHVQARHPWLPYHENLTGMSARLVGARPSEVVVMNSLTVNLHLMMVSFYRPTKNRYKILIEGGAFPSDQYAAKSQAQFHGFAPEIAVVELKADGRGPVMTTEEILAQIDKHGESTALVLLGQVNYLSGQAFDVPAIVKAAKEKGCLVGLNLAHGAGNLVLCLHDWDVDFAVWCSYKYLNSGPGSIAGAFVHERHLGQKDLPRFAGWWGHNKESRFLMGPVFDPIPTAEAWQLSNPPIFQMAALRASMEMFDKVTMPVLRKKGDRLTGYLEFLLEQIPGATIITPKNPQERGSQLSIRFDKGACNVLPLLKNAGVICDFRAPDIIRAAPAPFYNSFYDVYKFAQILRELIG